jgi:hypothetical protein
MISLIAQGVGLVLLAMGVVDYLGARRWDFQHERRGTGEADDRLSRGMVAPAGHAEYR